MFKIVRFPSKLQFFFDSLQNHFPLQSLRILPNLGSVHLRKNQYKKSVKLNNKKVAIG